MAYYTSKTTIVPKPPGPVCLTGVFMKEKIDKFIDFFTTITKEECDNIEEILSWDDETKAAFFLAKRIFEEGDPYDHNQATPNAKRSRDTQTTKGKKPKPPKDLSARTNQI
jgi:hypothetical protein